MIASPVIPGRCYRVKHQGRTINVLAGHACDAICIALGMLGLWTC